MHKFTFVCLFVLTDRVHLSQEMSIGLQPNSVFLEFPGSIDLLNNRVRCPRSFSESPICRSDANIAQKHHFAIFRVWESSREDLVYRVLARFDVFPHSTSEILEL